MRMMRKTLSRDSVISCAYRREPIAHEAARMAEGHSGASQKNKTIFLHLSVAVMAQIIRMMRLLFGRQALAICDIVLKSGKT